MPAMMKSAVEFQLRALDSGAVDLTSSLVRSTRSDIPLPRRMLNICIDIASLIAPRDAALTMPVLNRPDPSLQNLIVPSERPEIVRCAIDWQGAAILPFIISSGLPRPRRN